MAYAGGPTGSAEPGKTTVDFHAWTRARDYIALPTAKDAFQAEYVWIGGLNSIDLRSKGKVRAVASAPSGWCSDHGGGVWRRAEAERHARAGVGRAGDILLGQGSLHGAQGPAQLRRRAAAPAQTAQRRPFAVCC
jgi:hypothetical protein